MLADMPSDIPVLLKLIMLWLSAFVSFTDVPFNVKVASRANVSGISN
jgi:hypothetical protein